MKRILQISNYYYPNIGGIEQVARDISNALRDSDGFINKVICFNENSRDGDYICYRRETVHEIIDGTEIIKCGCITKISSQSLSLSFGKELNNIMNSYKPDIVIFHYPNPFQAYYLLKYKAQNFKLLLYWHLDITKQTILKHLFYRQNINLINRMEYVVGATPMHVNASEFTSQFGDKKKILPYMINTTKLVLSEKEKDQAIRLKEKYKDNTIGFFIGRHIPYKGLKYLIEASKMLNNVPIKIIVAGSGELTEELKEQARGDPKIEFIGKLSDSERRVYYEACDIICFPSITRNEAFGLALAEGMYFGKPAVTFHIQGSGVNYVNLANVTGLECPNGDSSSYAAALKRLTEDKELRHKYGEAARKRVLENFTPQQFKTNLMRLLADL